MKPRICGAFFWPASGALREALTKRKRKYELRLNRFGQLLSAFGVIERWCWSLTTHQIKTAKENAMQTQPAPRTLDLAARGTRPLGTGYGRSSSYGTPRSYSQSSVPARFRVA